VWSPSCAGLGYRSRLHLVSYAALEGAAAGRGLARASGLRAERALDFVSARVRNHQVHP
jgi:hypothetical protein